MLPFYIYFIYRLPFLIYMLFTGSLFFHVHHIYMHLFFRFPCYLQAPFFNSRIYKLPSLINMLFTASLFGLTFLIHMLFTDFWQPPSVLNLHVISRLNHKKFAGYQILQYFQVQFTVIYQYMILALCFETFTVFCPSLTCFTFTFFFIELQKHHIRKIMKLFFSLFIHMLITCYLHKLLIFQLLIFPVNKNNEKRTVYLSKIHNKNERYL